MERKPGIKLDSYDQRLIENMIHEGNPNDSLGRPRNKQDIVLKTDTAKHDIQPLTDEMEVDRQKHLERQNHMGG